ncbi:YhhN-like protein [Sporotomaculum syntrophicum]|uniref:YhhN-like protein n=1 Tax=Sporotomaculum syntrophicum TaxID=182264 RepID=A0A9D2WPZ6_9FIRM|nr:lysoplasmalogenase family protein [Sporotomaculum syntrophicum]KAF1084963.1 YhhN-like protein [Sporotomaculum syntrophicum]
MSVLQKKLLYTFLILTVLIVTLDNIFPGNLQNNYIKYAVVLALFMVTLRLKKRYTEQILMNIAVFLIAAADFFLVFCNTIPAIGHELDYIGVLGFLLAYSVLIPAFNKNFSPGWGEVLAAVPVIALFIPNCLILMPYVSGITAYGAVIFSLVLCCMTWTAICTIFRRYYTPAVARRIALAGFLMLVCDLGVAHSFLNPVFAGRFVPWLANIIWAAYVPAWTLIVLTIAEEKLYLSKAHHLKESLDGLD